jgi:hypothetical protein
LHQKNLKGYLLEITLGGEDTTIVAREDSGLHPV